MKRIVLSLLGVLAAVFVVALVLRGNAATNLEVASSKPAAGNAGYRVAVDPATGQFVEPETVTAGEAGKTGLDALSRSDHGLVEEASPVPGGGVMVNLQGRFQNTFTATTDADGKLAIECDTDDDTSGQGE
jgi:hypothetical protein